jgi:hypothetical protein
MRDMILLEALSIAASRDYNVVRIDREPDIDVSDFALAEVRGHRRQPRVGTKTDGKKSHKGTWDKRPLHDASKSKPASSSLQRLLKKAR